MPTGPKGGKRREPEPTKRQALATAFRRWVIRKQSAEKKARGQSEAKADVRHKRAIARREKTKTLAVYRVKACQRYLSPHAIEQLAAVSRNHTMSAEIRIKAASAIIRLT